MEPGEHRSSNSNSNSNRRRASCAPGVSAGGVRSSSSPGCSDSTPARPCGPGSSSSSSSSPGPHGRGAGEQVCPGACRRVTAGVGGGAPRPRLLGLALALVLLLLLLGAPAHVAGQGANSLVTSSQLPAMQALNTSFPVNNRTWRATVPCNQWLGVVCDNKGNVQSISLSLYDLASPPSLPSQVGSLISLTYLQINGGLPGFLPSTLSSLRALQFLDLTENALTGTFSPPSTLTALSTLSISSNGFTGSIPTVLSLLTGLVHLVLGDNSLSGSIPNIFAPLQRLKALDLSDNALWGTVPASLTQIPQLVFLDIGSNQLSGPAPVAFSSRALGTVDATYRINGNYFTRSPVTTVPQNNGNGNNKVSWFCPLLQQGGYALINLVPFGCQILSSFSQNCFNTSTDPWAALGSASRSLLSEGDSEGTTTTNNNNNINNNNGGFPERSSGSAVRGRMLASKKIPPGQLKKWKDLYNTGAVGSLLTGPWGRGRKKGFKGSYGGLNGTSSLCYFESQKTPQMCAAFCNAVDPKGPCTSLGTCAQDTSTFAPNCTCTAPAMFTYSLSYNVSYFDEATKRGVPYFPSCTADPKAVYFPPGIPGIKYNSFPTNFTTGLLLNPNATAPSIPSKFNKYFRHFSVGFQGSYASPSWDFPSSKDWRAGLGPFNQSAVSSIKDQKSCAACWVFSTVGAVESALAISGIATAPNISTQQVLDCVGNGNCQGGNPVDALNYFAYTFPGVPSEASYPYLAAKGTCPAGSNTYRLLFGQGGRTQAVPSRGAQGQQQQGPRRRLGGPKYGRGSEAPAEGRGRSLQANGLNPVPASPYFTSMYEQASYSGWFGILQAVQVQPVIADLEADQQSFLTYPGGFVYNDPSCFVNQILTHSVLVVGYDLTGAVPYWILKNSWGTNWGEAGYMRLAIQGGFGICGINYTPVRYPVVARGSTPCGPINPCGGGTCVATTGGFNTCTNCPPNFMPVTNLDGSQSCAPTLVCNLFDLNPCGVGTCVDDAAGGYSCLCPPPVYTYGFSTNGNPTCIPGNSSSSLSTKPGMTCDLIRTAYGLSLAAFAALNPTVNCNLVPLPSGVTLNVANPSYGGCQLYYSVAAGDTCPSVEAVFGISLAILNPDLNCDALVPGEQVCVQAGTPLQYLCTQYYAVAPGDSCSSIALTVADPPLPPQSFYAFNPGLICSNLQPAASSSGLSLYSSLFGTQVCISAVPANVTVGLDGAIACSFGKYTVLAADTCAKVYTKVYCNKVTLFTKYNGFSCTTTSLYVGRVLCKPPASCT